MKSSQIREREFAMAEQYQGVRIYAAFQASDIRVYLDSLHDDEREVDVEATLNMCEQGINQALTEFYTGAWILVKRQDEPSPASNRTRVETDNVDVDPELIGQEVDDLVSEFDITQYVVYRGG